jgi:lipoprotein-anchoring transpeptidase ErfK/SrfK
MSRALLAAAVFLSIGGPAAAQSWVPWHQPTSYERRQTYEPPSTQQQPGGGLFDPPQARRRGPGPKLLDGGGRPSIQPMSPQSVSFPSGYAPGTVVIDTAGRKLYLVRSKVEAYRYPISVGREGFTWTGSERISRVADWPDWHPPKEMRERDRSLPEKMTGGVRNPLGAKAMYLGNSLYRIHGTNSAQSIGRANSSGCFRMMNGHVVDLSRRVGVGTKVVVLRGLPSQLARRVSDD